MTEGLDCQQFEEQVVELALGGVDEPRRAELARHAAQCPACHLRLEELSWLGERLLLLAPELEPPPGFESRVLDRLAAAGATGAGPLAASGGGARRLAGAAAGAGGPAGAGRDAGAAPTAAGRGGPVAAAGRRRPARRRVLAGATAAALVGAVVALGAVAATDRGGSDDRAAPAPTSTTVPGPDDRVAAIVRADGSVAGTAVLAADPRPHLLVTVDAPRPRATPVSCELVGPDGRAVIVGSWTFADVEQGAWAVGIDAALVGATAMVVRDDTGTVVASATFSR